MLVPLKTLCMLLFIGLSCPLLAQSPGAVAYVNLQLIQKQLPAYAAANNEVETFSKAIIADLNRQQKELEHKYRASTAKADTAAYYTALRRESQAYSQQVARKQGDIAKKREQTLARVNETITKAVQEVAREKGYSGVIDTVAVIYYDPAQDITASVLTRLGVK